MAFPIIKRAYNVYKNAGFLEFLYVTFMYLRYVFALFFLKGIKPSQEQMDLLPELGDVWNAYVRECMRKTLTKTDQRIALPKEYFYGKGLEIGAFHSPLPLPKNVEIIYADKYTVEELHTMMPETTEKPCIIPNIICDGLSLEMYGNESFDFVIANQMLEHVQDVVQTIDNHLRVLKKGGLLFYALPDKRFTLDKKRELTTVEHIIEDYIKGPEKALRDHLVEYFTIVDGNEGEVLKKRVEEYLRTGRDIHYHVWTVDSFRSQIEIICKDYINASLLELKKNGQEFICLLQKN